MTTREYKTITAYRNERDSLQSCGYRFVQRFAEPNNSFSVVLQHPRTLRILTITTQPQWGLVLIKEKSQILRMITIN